MPLLGRPSPQAHHSNYVQVLQLRSYWQSRAFSLIFTEFLRKGTPSFHSLQVIVVQVSCPGLGFGGQQSRGFTQVCLPPTLRQQPCCHVSSSPF